MSSQTALSSAVLLRKGGKHYSLLMCSSPQVLSARPTKLLQLPRSAPWLGVSAMYVSHLTWSIIVFLFSFFDIFYVGIFIAVQLSFILENEHLN